MNNELIYVLKVNIAIALFYLFYRLFFARDTFWKTRRFYLLLSILISFSYPMLSVANWLQNQQPLQKLIANYTLLQEITVTPENTGSTFSIENILLIIYGIVLTTLIIRLLIQFISIVKVKSKGTRMKVWGYDIIAIEKEITPFSFFGTVCMNPSLHNETETKQILTHEFTHVRQMHSIDVLIGEFLSIVFWFNPATWLLKREIRQNLEFLADNNVLSSGVDTKTYQYHLLQLSYQTHELKIANKFNVSPLKKRITMMNQKKTSKAGILKYLLVAPLALALVVSSNAETIISSVEKSIKDEAVQQAKKTATQKSEKVSKSSLDEMVVVGYADTTTTKMKKTVTPPPPPPVPAKDETVPPPPPPVPAGEKLPPPPPPVAASESVDDVVFMEVEKMPEFPGGINALFKYLAQNVKYPVAAQKKGAQGRVICQFIVSNTGAIKDVKIIRGVDPDLDAEAIRVVKAMPEWTPGQQKGKNVNVKYTLPINFKLDGKKNDAAGPSTKPVVILDGKKQAADFDVNSIDPKTISSINVLKGDNEKRKAELIALYGNEATNGVMEITLKK